MNIAIVGGGSRCLYLMDFIQKHNFQLFSPKVIAVADVKNDAVGLVEAGKRGIFVTNDYNDFFDREDIDLIVELTDNMDIYNDLTAKRKKGIRVISHKTALLFYEIASVAKMEKEAKLKLNQARTIYELIINQLIQEELMVIKTDYRIVDINEFMAEKLGLKKEDAIGRFCYEITHHRKTPCSGKHHPCPLRKMMKKGRPCKTIHTHLDKSKNELYYSISCYPFKEEGEIVGAIEIARDITKEIKMQQNIMQQEKLISIGRLSAGIAHEINNPLTTIMTSSMLLQEEHDPDDPIYSELETISKEALRCRKIVQSLLDFARQTKPIKKLYDINEVIRDSIHLTRKQAQFDDIEIETKLFEKLPQVYIDKDQIQQAIINLTLNAIEATESGGKISFSTEYNPATAMIVIDVSDTGCGIPPENIDKIFDPFFTTRETGTGLGLAITHGIIEQHGGKIEINSTPGKGTRFTIMLPIRQGEKDAA